MARRIEIFDTTLRDGNKLPFVVLSTADRVQLAHQLERLGVDVIEAGFPADSPEEEQCVRRVAQEVGAPWVAALARARDADVEAALGCLSSSRKGYLHLYMAGSPHFLRNVLKRSEQEALTDVQRCINAARRAGVRVQFSLSEAPHARREFLLDACRAAREAGASVINLADTNGIMVPEDVADMVGTALQAVGKGAEAPIIGIHCHNDLGLATANTLAALRAGAAHVEVTLGGFGERAGNAPLEEVAFCISAFGERFGLSHGIVLQEIARTSALFDCLTGVRTHPNKAVTGECAFLPAPGGFAGQSLEPRLHALLQETTIGRTPGQHLSPEDSSLMRGAAAPEIYALDSFSVITGSHSPPVGVVVIRRDGNSLTQTSHGNGPIDALFRAVDKALGFSTRVLLYSVSTLSAGSEARTQVTITVELRGRRFHGRHISTDVIESSLRAYLAACNAIGASGILEGPADFHVTGEYLWE